MTSMSAAVLFSIAGVAMLVAGALALRRTQRFLRYCASSNGIIARIVCPDCVSLEHAPYYTAVVAFEDASGHPLEFEWPNGTNPPPYREGQRVEVLYDAQNPRRAVVKCFTSLWYTALTLLGAGAVFTAGGLGLLFTSP